MQLLYNELSHLNFDKLGNRQAAWFGHTQYSYGIYCHSVNNNWPECLLHLRAILLNDYGLSFDSALVNYYVDGHSSVGWHSDNEKTLQFGYPIASLSLGTTRLFQIRQCNGNIAKSFNLSNGTLIMMQGDLQREFVHRVTADTSISAARINITFRRSVKA